MQFEGGENIIEKLGLAHLYYLPFIQVGRWYLHDHVGT